MAKSKGGFASLNKKDKVDFYISLAVIALAGILVLSFSFPFNTSTYDGETSLLNENSLDITSIAIDDKKYVPVSKPFSPRARVEYLAPLPAKNIESISYQADPVSLSSDEDEISQVEDEVDEQVEIVTHENDININHQDISSELDSQDLGTEKQTEIELEEIQEITTPEPIEKKDKEVEEVLSENCVIIIGAFGETKNIVKLMRALEKDGYTPFTTPFRGLERVGIYHPCNSKTIQSTLKTVRKKYAKDAMILVGE